MLSRFILPVWLCWHISSILAPDHRAKQQYTVQFFYRDLAEISRRDCRDLDQFSPWCLSFWISARSLRYLLHLAEIGEISSRLQRSGHDVCGFLKSQRDRGEIFYIWPIEIAKISPRLPESSHDVRISVRSRRDFERHEHLTEIAYISPRSRRDLETTRVSLWPHQNCHHLAESSEIVENIYKSIFCVEINCFVVDH